MAALKDKLRRMLFLSDGESRGVLWLLPLLAVVAVIFVVAFRPGIDKSLPEDRQSRTVVDDKRYSSAEGELGDPVSGNEGMRELFEFDPNTVTLQELCRLGFPVKVAAGIIKYRTKGKRFEIPEDFATCYGVSLEHYTVLEPYIVIGEAFQARPFAGSGSGGRARGDGGGEAPAAGYFDPNLTDAEGFRALGFSAKQAEVLVRYRESIGGFGSVEDFARCYVVSEETFDRLSPYIRIAKDSVAISAMAGAAGRPAAKGEKVEINGADSALLRSVSGIGEVLVGRIMEYRRALGGFARKEQLAEVPGMSEANYERIMGQIRVDTLAIQKIDINFASHKNLVEGLGNHPYMTAKILRKLLKERQLKGGWSNITEMVDQHIMTRTEAERLAPYLLFNRE